MSSSLGFTRSSSHFVVAPHPSLRFIPKTAGTVDSSPAMKIATATTDAPEEAQGTTALVNRFSVVLCLGNILLCGVHLALAIFVALHTIRFPISVFETRLTNESIVNMSCVFDYAKDDDGNYFCSSDADVPTGNRSAPDAYCRSVVDDYDDDVRTTLSDTGGPRLEAYELKRFGLGYQHIDDEGRAATRWILFSIEATTSLFHLLYALSFFVMRKNIGVATELAMQFGGLPARWVEYSITAGLMAFFLSNVANQFDLYALIAFSLGTFALQYFGAVIEGLLVQRHSERALVVFFFPALALFALAWTPVIRSLATDIFQLSCITYKDDSFLHCEDKTCFGKEVPINVYVFSLLMIYTVFPLIILWKIFFVAQWYRAPDMVARPVLRRFFGANKTRARWLCQPLYGVSMALVRTVAFLGFIPMGAIVASVRMLKEILAPFVFRSSSSQWFSFGKDAASDTRHLLLSFFLGEMLFAIASASSKVFLTIYFLQVFAMRDW